MKEDFLDTQEHQAYQDRPDYRVPLALQGLLDHQVPQALLDLQVKRAKWA